MNKSFSIGKSSKKFRYAVTDEDIEHLLNNIGNVESYHEEWFHSGDTTLKRRMHHLTCPPTPKDPVEYPDETPFCGIDINRYEIKEGEWIDVCTYFINGVYSLYYAYRTSITPLDGKETAHRIHAFIYRNNLNYVTDFSDELGVMCSNSDIRDVNDMPGCLQYEDDEQ
jgi:hypothetical protein